MPPKKDRNLQLRMSRGQLTLVVPPKVVTVDNTEKDIEKEKEAKRPRSEDEGSDSNINPGKKPHEDVASLPSSSESVQLEVEKMEDLVAEKEVLMQQVDSLLGASEKAQALREKIDGFLQRAEEYVKKRTLSEVDVDSIKQSVREDIMQEMEYNLREDRELERTGRSVCIQGLRPLVDQYLDGKASQEDILTGIVLSITNNRVTVLSCRQWRSTEDNSLQSYTVELGSRQQKAALYRYVAAHMRTNSQWAAFLKPLSFRDLVPKQYMAEAKVMLKKAAEAKQKREILAYKVKVVGYECLPSMVVKTTSRGWHTVDMVKSRRGVRRPSEAGTSGGPEGADRSEWQQQRKRRGGGRGGGQGMGSGAAPTDDDREASLQRLTKNMKNDPTSYIGRVEQEITDAQQALARFCDLRDNFYEAMKGTEWQAEQDRRDEDCFQEL